jgi:phage terminase large subunit-like protein
VPTARLIPGATDLVVDQVFPSEERWEPKGRPPLEPHQIPPERLLKHEGRLWLLEAGRGAGKTEAVARYVAGYMRSHPGHRGRIIAPTFGDAVEACIEGPSGLKEIDPSVKWLPSAPGGARVKWPNGSEMLVIGTPFPKDVDRLRAGGNRHLDWWEEMAANPQLKKAWDQAAFGLRLGDHPHAVASTTPRNTTDYENIRDMTETILVNGIPLTANPHNPKEWVDYMRRKYEGTRLGRQEFYGELLEDVEGALWTRKRLDAVRVPAEDNRYPEMAVIVVAIDPAASAGEDSSDTGIIVAGIGVDGLGYVLEDRTCHLGPDGWGQRAVGAFRKWSADYIVGEVNNGGDMVEHVIATIDSKIRFKQVRASRGKQTRAQPVATLYGSDDDENGPARPSVIRHVGPFNELEDQLTTWVPEEEKSPDRLDALVWALTELFLEEQEEQSIIEYHEPVRIGADL